MAMSSANGTVVTQADVEAFRASLCARLGLPDTASSLDIERAHEIRVEFLSRAPEEMEDWAHDEIARADEAFTLLSAPQSDLEAAARDASTPVPEQDPHPLGATPAPTVIIERPRMARSTKVLLALAGVAAVVFGVYRMGGTGVPDMTAMDPAAASTSEQSATGVDPAAIMPAMQRIAEDPEDLDALKDLGDLYFDAGDYTTAAQWHAKAVEVDPKDVEALLALGAAQFNGGDAASAKANWEQAVDLDPGNAEAHYDLGFLALSVEPVDLDTTRAHWQKVIDIDPTSELAASVTTHLEGLEEADAAPGSDGGSQAEK
jgi:cytochrome c-type biogenesis protein CcmH/NrfG